MKYRATLFAKKTNDGFEGALQAFRVEIEAPSIQAAKTLLQIEFIDRRGLTLTPAHEFPTVENLMEALKEKESALRKESRKPTTENAKNRLVAEFQEACRCFRAAESAASSNNLIELK